MVILLCAQAEPEPNISSDSEEEESCSFSGEPEEQWALALGIEHADLPMKVVFLDKSGSMGCDETTHMALKLAAMNSLQPHAGSTLSFFMAGPGETEVTHTHCHYCALSLPHCL